jgi:glycosidase
MQVYNRGLRRRAPTMLDGDPDRVRLLYSLMFSIPGTPVLFYGEELGMGENLAADQRLAVRTPMQWTGGRNGGFSDAPSADLVSQVVRGAYGPKSVNAEQQRSDPDSMHAFVRALMRAYRECPELGWGAFTLLDCDQPGVLAHRCTWQDRAVVALHNLTDRPVSATVTLPEGVGPVRMAEPLGDVRMETDGHGRLDVRLGRYGRQWLCVLD